MRGEAGETSDAGATAGETSAALEAPSAGETAGVVARSPAVWFGLLFAAVFLLTAGVIVGCELDPNQPWPDPSWRRERVDLHQLVLATLAALGVLGYGVLRRLAWLHTRRATRALQLGLAALILVSSAYYFLGRHALSHRVFAHQWDSYHYALGPKYYDELDYFDLYRCTAQALDRRSLPDDARVRDLRDYRMTTAGAERARGDCRAQFSPARWDQFKRDLEVVDPSPRRKQLRAMLGDRGYNGTPVHSVISGWLVNRLPMTWTSRNLMPLLDIGGLCVMLWVVARAFGWRIGLTFALFFFLDIVDRYRITGGSWFRYYWLITLVLGVCALRARQHARAGAWLAASAALNLFPLVFMLGLGVKGAVELARTRRLPARLVRFAAGALITALALGVVGSLSARGPAAYASFARNMQVHDVRGRFPGFGVGLKFAFVYRGEHAPARSYSERKKQEEFREARPVYLATAALLIGLAALLCPRLDDVEATALLGFTVMFCQLETTGYYFACACLLVLLWHHRARGPPGMLLLALLFGLNALAYAGLLRTHLFFLYNTILSLSWAAYLIATLATLGVETGLLRELSSWLMRPAPARADDDDDARA
ncbi:MAG: hypothetical protein H6713_40490 [Myxococcales bacterium]|nr:hypothetical protein [Myxococcales bacterium]MCB9756240.1 hypothetical protein [Myxococcales bacterium]